MRKEEYLEKLKDLLYAALEKEDAENAYSYYLELFEEEDTAALIERIGTPEEVLESCLKINSSFSIHPVPHSIRNGFSRLFSIISKRGWKGFCALLYLVFLFLVVLLLTWIFIYRLFYLAADFSLGPYALKYVLSDLARLSILALLAMLSLRHLPYLVIGRLEKRRKSK